jgi:hypothetical protein
MHTDLKISSTKIAYLFFVLINVHLRSSVANFTYHQPFGFIASALWAGDGGRGTRANGSRTSLSLVGKVE